MNGILSFFIRILIAFPASFIVWGISFFSFDQTFLLSSAYAAGGWIAAYSTTSILLKQRFLKKQQLTRGEYKYIQKNLDEASPKVLRLQKTLLSIRELPTVKQRIELVRVVRKIHNLTKKEPKRFFQAERFYFSHLDSAVQLTEKYMFLSSQPKKSADLTKSLVETKNTLDELKQYIEQDLYQVIANDIEDLHYEIDVAKHSIRSLKESQILKKAGEINERK